MNWTVTTKPTTLPIEWRSYKAFLRLDDDSYRQTVLDIAAGCVAEAEQKMVCSLMARTITAQYWPRDLLHLPRGPVATVTSVTDKNNATLTYERYTIGNSDRIKLLTANFEWPITVVYVAGVASAADIDADIIQALKISVNTLYYNREAIVAGNVSRPYDLDCFYRARSRGIPVA